MEPIVITFQDAFIGALGSSAFLALIWLGKHIISLSHKIDSLIIADKNQTEAISILTRIQRPQLIAHKATLEALQDGRCNGNVTEAREEISKATKQFDNYLLGA